MELAVRKHRADVARGLHHPQCVPGQHQGGVRQEPRPAQPHARPLVHQQAARVLCWLASCCRPRRSLRSPNPLFFLGVVLLRRIQVGQAIAALRLRSSLPMLAGQPGLPPISSRRNATTSAPTLTSASTDLATKCLTPTGPAAAAPPRRRRTTRSMLRHLKTCRRQRQQQLMPRKRTPHRARRINARPVENAFQVFTKSRDGKKKIKINFKQCVHVCICTKVDWDRNQLLAA